MKKTIITALVVLLVMLAFATCDSFITEPGAEKSGYTYTADGQKLVTLKVKTSGIAGSSRGIDNNIAHEAANWVEVIFKDQAGKFHKTDGILGFTLSVTVPVEIYNSGNSLMLIGKKRSVGTTADYTLLATGVPQKSVDLLHDDPEITFIVASLSVDLSTNGDSFEILNETLGDFKDITATIPFDHTKTGKFFVKDSPSCFLVPAGETINAKLTVDGLGYTGDKIKVEQTADKNDFVTFTKFNGGSSTITLGTSFSAPTLSLSGCVFEFPFITGTDSKGLGDYVITFDIPVFGFNDEAVVDETDSSITGLPWFIRGGTILGNPDFNDAGEGVALVVANSVAGDKVLVVPTK